MEDNREIKKEKTTSLPISIQDSGFPFLDELPDDIAAAIISKCAADASCPADFFNLLLTCQRLKRLGFRRMVLSQVSPKAFTCKPQSWCNGAHQFLKSCADADNLEACYTLGMILFYCVKNGDRVRARGVSLLSKGALLKHAASTYALAVIVLKRSGAMQETPWYREIGFWLASEAAALDHLDAIREMGYCLMYGIGVQKDDALAQRILVQVIACEIASTDTSATPRKKITTPPSIDWYELARWLRDYPYVMQAIATVKSPHLCDYGCIVKEMHPANQFLIDWFHGDAGDTLRICGREGCGRPETRVHEFIRCRICRAVSYCSLSCYAFDSKSRHEVNCVPMEDNEDGFEEVEAGFEEVEAAGEGDGNDIAEWSVEEIGIEVE